MIIKHSIITLFILTSALIMGCSDIPGIAANNEEVNSLEDINYSVDTGKVAAIAAGNPKSPRVIFIHGTPGDKTGFADFLLSVPQNRYYISVDRPGFGDSEPEAGLMSLKDQAKAIAPLLKTIDGNKPILVGHSLGGPLILKLGIDYPDKIGALISLAGSFDPDLENPHWAQYIGDTWLGNLILPRHLSVANKELLVHEKELRILSAGLSTVEIPTYIVQGKEDKLVPEANADFLAQSLPAGALREDWRLSKQNHFLPWNNPASVNRALELAIKTVWSQP